MREHSIAPLDDEKPRRKFGGPQEGAGRPLGSLNRITADLKRAILDGCVSCDYAFDPNDASAPPSITTYMRNVANKHPELFFSAIVKLIPREVRTHLSNDTTVDVTLRTMNDVRRALEAEGFGSKEIRQLEALLPSTGKPLDDDAEDVEEIFERDRGVA